MPRSGQARVNTTFSATDRMKGPMNRMQRNVTGFSSNAQRSLGRTSASFMNMSRVVRIAGAAIVTGLIGRGIRGLVGAAADIETVTTQFETLTGSIDNANRLVQDMQDFASQTPLQFDTLAQGTQRLLAFGIAQEDIIQTMQTLGDAALGDADKLNSLTRAYGKVSARGKASMEEINMVIDAGVPIMDALNEQFGTTTEELTGMISRGEVTSEVFQDAFRTMTREGGQFNNGMQRQSQTTAGLMSTLKDNIQLTAAGIGQSLLPTVKDLTDRLISVTRQIRAWVSENEDLIQQKVEDTLQNIADAGRTIARFWNNGTIPAILAAVVAFKAMTTAVRIGEAALVAFKGAKLAYTAATQGATVAARLFNVVLKKNPIGLIITAIAAVVGAIIWMIKNWDKVTEVISAVWDHIKQFAEWLGGVFEPIGDAIRNAFVGAFENIITVAEAMWSFVSPIVDRIGSVVETVGNFLNRGEGRTVESGRAANAERYGMTTRNTAGLESTRSESVSRSEVDIRLGNLPAGSRVQQRGRAPGVSLAYGAEGGQL